MTSKATTEQAELPALHPATLVRRCLEQLRALSERHFLVLAGALALGYLALQVLYVRRIPLVMDEFDGAYDSNLLRHSIPYADFKPYKTVLGYYMQMPWLASAPDVWTGIMRTKLFLASVNAAAMWVVASVGARLYSRSAALLALPLCLLMTNWMDRSSELRVDTLTALAGIASLLLLLRGRSALAGCVCALSFLISQKGVYYAVASSVALAGTIVLPGAKPRSVLRECLRFGVPYLLTLGLYFGGFLAVASLGTTLETTFLSHRKIAFGEIYKHIRKFWTQTLEANPAFYALGLAALFVLGRRALALAFARGEREARDAANARRDLVLFLYALVLAALCTWHKQPWPYFFVLLVPTTYLLHVAWLDAAFAWLAARPARSALATSFALLVAVALVALGVVQPSTHLRDELRKYDSAYQRQMVTMTERLLGEHETYIAGMDAVYSHLQTTPELRRLSKDRLTKLRHSDFRYVRALLDTLRNAPPKVLLRNDRFKSLPMAIASWLRANYAPFYGSVELYAPVFFGGETTLDIAFPGSYRIKLEPGTSAQVGERSVVDGDTFSLPRGPLALRSKHAGRLYLRAPAAEAARRPRFQIAREFNATPYMR